MESVRKNPAAVIRKADTRKGSTLVRQGKRLHNGPVINPDQVQRNPVLNQQELFVRSQHQVYRPAGKVDLEPGRSQELIGWNQDAAVSLGADFLYT